LAESSGNTNEEINTKYAECGVNYISSGALTHSIYNMDLSHKQFDLTYIIFVEFTGKAAHFCNKKMDALMKM
jgi:hypothetical protein